MISHVETCAYCRAELELYQIFQAGEIEPGEAGAVSEITERLRARSQQSFGRERSQVAAGRSWWRTILATSWLTPAALTVAGLLVAIAIGLQLRHGGPPTLHPVNEAGQPVMRSTAVAVIAPVGDLQAPPTRIQWRALPGAVKYRVRLLEVDSNELWAAEAVGAFIDLPAAVQARIVPGKSILCQVSAYSSSGARIAESELIRFRVLQNIYSH